ncbi:MAG: anti-sigma factor [Candidatus Binatus sp.]|uniref:anti-sigma factor domain-containing protein n=1 Tax=Candidatus Binatus sp. TaxID=2811406 RepID=UPI00271DF896|nr:anti-sigma factor [Candidatus Binatus sp.]MDO8433699.1 anti-sigma factor [Candidatus Binatus sp.]
MDQGEASARIESSAPVEDTAEQPPRLRRVRLWQAIAGMALAVSIASSIVTIELSKSLARRTNYLNRRVAALNTTVRTLKKQTSVVQRKLGSERERATVGETFEKILFAPDLRTIKLAPPDKSTANGILAMSESANAAMLEANGLKPSGDLQVYRIWWVPRRGAAVWAADFLVGEDGTATVPVDLPPPRQRAPTIEITLEDQAYADDPSGPLALRGHLAASK